MVKHIESDLIENKRSEIVDKLTILNKFKELPILPNSTILTTSLIAQYFEVSIEVIKSIYHRNKEQLKELGSFTLRREGLKLFKLHTSNSSVFGSSSAVTVFNLDSILLISFYLTKSRIAQQIREELLAYPNLVEKFKEFISKQSNSLIKENEINEILINVFEDVCVIERSVCYKSYYLDFVLSCEDFKIAIECDEYGHSNYNKEKESKREKEIKESYTLIRFNPDSGESATTLINKILKVIKEKLK